MVLDFIGCLLWDRGKRLCKAQVEWVQKEMQSVGNDPPSHTGCAEPWHLINHRLRNVPGLKAISKSMFGFLMSPPREAVCEVPRLGLGFISRHQHIFPQE